jgi:hypothetical protein
MGLADQAEVPQKDRVLRLSQAPEANKSLKGPFIVVTSKSYMGSTTAQGARMFGKVAKAQGEQEKPTCALLLESKTNPGDVVAKPGMSPTEDHLKFEWIEQGGKIRMDLASFMVLKEIVIPAGMKLYIPLYEDTDEEHGPVVGLGLKEMRFVKVQSRTKPAEAAS